MAGIAITINGKACAAEVDETLLSVARRNDIFIPTLCHSKALPGQGCCRVCMVEIDEGRGPRMVAACVYRLVGDARVETESERTKLVRRTTLGLLRARAPESLEIRAMCQFYGVADKPHYVQIAGEKCVMCGLCAKACEKNGTHAISTVGRGVAKKISTPYDEPSFTCIGCGSCAEACPTGAIKLTEQNGIRTIWGKDFQLLKCPRCGRLFATEEELALSRERAGWADEADLCEDCRRELLAWQMNEIFCEAKGD